MKITIIGSGAIGGTLGAHMIRAGHDITLCDADEAHVAAIRERGLVIEGPVNEFTVAARAVTPDGLPDRIEHAIVAVKSPHTRAAAELLRGRLTVGGYVLTVQNGLTADTLIDVVGRDRVICCRRSASRRSFTRPCRRARRSSNSAAAPAGSSGGWPRWDTRSPGLTTLRTCSPAARTC